MSTPVRHDGEPRVLVLDRTGELASRLRHKVVGRGAVVTACRNLARAEAHLAASHWDVLVAGPSFMHHSGLRRVGSLHQRYPWLSVVLALTERPRADLAEIIQVGADDLLPLHADDAELGRALIRAARITRGRLGVAAGHNQRGRIVMISSASGGSGKTVAATNAAEFLVRTTGQPVVLLDLDLQFGEVSTALRLRPELTITDALAAEAEGHELDDHLDEYLLPHPDGFSVLAAPRLPAEADSITGGDITRILDVLRARGTWVVLDTHEGLSDIVVAALEMTDHVFALATPDRPSIANLHHLLQALDRLGVASDSISVVLNKVEADAGFDPLDIAAQLGRRLAAVVPYDRQVSFSVNVGVPLLAGEPRSAVAAALTSAFVNMLPGTTAPVAGPVEERSARRFLSRRPKAAPLPAGPPAPAITAVPPAPTPPRPVPPLPVPPLPAPVPLLSPAVPDVAIDLTDPVPPPAVEPQPLAPAPPAFRGPAPSGPRGPSTPAPVATRCRGRSPPPDRRSSRPRCRGRPGTGSTSEKGVTPPAAASRQHIRPPD
jgi:pilus assembly protein CpaE